MNFQEMKKAVYEVTGATVGAYAGLVGGSLSAAKKVLEGKPEEAGQAFMKTGGNIVETCTDWAGENGDAVIATTTTIITAVGGIKNITDKKS